MLRGQLQGGKNAHAAAQEDVGAGVHILDARRALGRETWQIHWAQRVLSGTTQNRSSSSSQEAASLVLSKMG
jgi:hypothetical protein